MKKLLSLDLSTISSGWAVFDLETEKLLEYGVVKPSVKGISKLRYPVAAYHRIVHIAEQIFEIVLEHEPTEIIIEEVNKGKSRITQKSLDALHFFVLDYLCFIDPEWLPRVHWVDSNGPRGWRTAFGMKAALIPKEERKGRSRSEVWKKLAENYVNAKYGTKFDVWGDKSHSDICDSISVGSYFFEIRKHKV